MVGGEREGTVRLLPLPGVFQPRSDSHMLAEHVSREALPRNARVLDLCTGSGLIAVAAALAHHAEVVAVDVSRRAVWAARLNAAINGVRVRAVRGDLFAAVEGEQFDLIASNPPYLPGPAKSLPQRGPSRAWEGGVHGRVFIDRICDQALDHLRPGGRLLLLQSSVCDVQATLTRLAGRGLEAEVAFTHRGPLGPILKERVDWLRRQGVLGAEEQEDVVIIRARRTADAVVAAGVAQRPNTRSSRRPRAGASAIADRVSESPARSSVSPTSTGSIES
jgi:release factor glutamine methyltransferase